MFKYECIVIGGSWGALGPVLEIIRNLPAAFIIPVIVILHRQKNIESSLVSLLRNNTKLKVCEIVDKLKITGRNIYICPANYHVLIEKDKTFVLDVSEPENYSRPSIDVTFESAANVFEDRLIAILLSGLNSDGSNGLKKISDNGGLAIIQNPDEAEAKNMPNAAKNKVNSAKTMNVKEIFLFLQSL